MQTLMFTQRLDLRLIVISGGMILGTIAKQASESKSDSGSKFETTFFGVNYF